MRRRHTADSTMLIVFGTMGYVLGFALLSFIGWGMYMHLTHM